MSYLADALLWASRGVQVLPVAPGQKFPAMIKEWQIYATTDPETITAWWTEWPTANIAGLAKDFVILDCDGQQAFNYLRDKKIPYTYQVQRGDHKHYYFLQPEEKLTRTIKIKPDIDIISMATEKGSYIMLPPSMHPSGDRYTEATFPFDWEKIKLLPQFILDMYAEALIEKEEKKNRVLSAGEFLIIEEGGRHEALKTFASKAKNMGMGPKALLDSLRSFNLESCKPPQKDEDVLLIAEWANNLGSLAVEDQKNLEIGDRMTRAMLENLQMKRAEEMQEDKTMPAGPCPENFMPRTGLIKETAEYIIKTSLYPQPIFAVIAATSMCAALCGRKWETKTGLRSNLYTISLAPSSAGKDKARKDIKNILNRAGLSNLLGGEELASGAGVFSAMVTNPVQLFMIDEFGYFLQSVTGKNAASYRRDIMTWLMKLYSSADTILKGPEYSDKKAKPTSVVAYPCAIIYGTSTHAQFFDAFTSSEAVSGQLARLMVFNTPEEPVDVSGYIEKAPIPEDILVGVKKAYESGTGDLRNSTNGEIGSDAQKVREDPKIKDLWLELVREMNRKGKDDATRSIYGRVAENTMKMALVYSFSINLPSNPSVKKQTPIYIMNSLNFLLL